MLGYILNTDASGYILLLFTFYTASRSFSGIRVVTILVGPDTHKPSASSSSSRNTSAILALSFSRRMAAFSSKTKTKFYLLLAATLIPTCFEFKLHIISISSVKSFEQLLVFVAFWQHLLNQYTALSVLWCSLQTVDGDKLSNFNLPSQAFRWRSLASFSGCSAVSFTVLRASSLSSRSFLLTWTSASLAWWNKSKRSQIR